MATPNRNNAPSVPHGSEGQQNTVSRWQMESTDHAIAASCDLGRQTQVYPSQPQGQSAAYGAQPQAGSPYNAPPSAPAVSGRRSLTLSMATSALTMQRNSIGGLVQAQVPRQSQAGAGWAGAQGQPRGAYAVAPPAPAQSNMTYAAADASGASFADQDFNAKYTKIYNDLAALQAYERLLRAEIGKEKEKWSQTNDPGVRASARKRLETMQGYLGYVQARVGEMCSGN